MTQTALEEFPEQSSLNPVLQAALSSLDVQLETELARYRRRQPQASRTKQPPNLLPENITTSTLAIAPETQDEPKPNPKLSAETRLQTEQPSSDPQVVLEKENSDLVHELAQLDEKTEPEAPEATIKEHPPEDYLASSEQLLNNLAEEEPIPAPQKKASLWSSLLTPLGISSILVFLVAGSLLAAAFVPEETWTKLGLEGLFGAEGETTEKSRTVASVEPETQPQAVIPVGPNLATEEFVDLNLSTLSKIKPSPSVPTNSAQSNLPTPPETPVSQSETPGPVVIKRSSDLATALLPPSLQPAPVPPANSSPGTTLTNPFPTSPSASTSGSDGQTGEKYVVLSEYSGESSLVKARAIAPDAFLRKISGNEKIQLATFNNQAEAEKYVENLQQQGISASVGQL